MNLLTRQTLHLGPGLDRPGPQPCRACGGNEHWQDVAGMWFCSICHPMPKVGECIDGEKVAALEVSFDAYA